MVDQLKKYIAIVIAIAMPFFYLTTTEDFFDTNKMYLLAYGVLILAIISLFQLLNKKNVILPKTPLAGAVLILATIYIYSTTVSTKNIFAALLHPNIGLISLLSLISWYYYLSLNNFANKILQYLFYLAPFFIAFHYIFTTFELFGQNLVNISTVGSLPNLIVYLAFFLIYGLVNISSDNDNSIATFVIMIILTLGISYYSFRLIQINSAHNKDQQSTTETQNLFIPYSHFWPPTISSIAKTDKLLFGYGIGNYSIMFDRYRESSFNNSPYWQLNINKSQSTALHILSESGLLVSCGFIMIFIIIFIITLKLALKSRYVPKNRRIEILYSIYFTIVFLLTSPSFTMLFLFFTTLAVIDQRVIYDISAPTQNLPIPKKTTIEIYPRTFVLLALRLFAILAIILCFLGGYLLGRSYLAEFYYQSSLKALEKNNATNVYNLQKKALQMNPFVEKTHIAASHINLIIANNLALSNNYNPTPKQRETISQAIQQSITEAKAAISLNPNNSQYWANLGLIYQTIDPLVSGADTWAISSFQRAIEVAPVNPLLRLSLGSIYLSQTRLSEAISTFEMGIKLKPDLANLYYNLAWAYYLARNSDLAIKHMEKTTMLVKKDSPDYKKAISDLEMFKKPVNNNKLPNNEAEDSEHLTLPDTQTDEINPKIEL